MKKVIYGLIIILSIFILTSSIKAWSEYKIGREVEYNGMEFYVIKDSSTLDDSVTMLKKEPLTYEEVNQYGAGHVNMYVTSSTSASYYQQAYNINYNGTDTGIGGMAYYSSSTCGSSGSSGCTTNYAESEIKYVVDAWKTAQAPLATNARLITLDDLRDNLGIELTQSNATSLQITVTEDTPTWVMGENYYYWTMTTNTDKTAEVWSVYGRSSAGVGSGPVQDYGYYRGGAVRPVITISKTALGDIDNSDEEKDIIPSNIDNTKKESKTNVKVDNTYMGKTIVLIILGFVSVCSSVSIFYIIKKKGA